MKKIKEPKFSTTMDDPERGGITGNRIYLEPRENEDISPFFFPNARDLPHFAGYTPQKKKRTIGEELTIIIVLIIIAIFTIFLFLFNS